jgi:citrate lyase subunit beta / citryl-CoA lyase
MSVSMPNKHPREVLLGAQAGGIHLPVCDHYSGVEVRMRKSLQLQAEMTQELGACVFDVTLDCEDGAAVGAEAEHAHLVVELALSAQPQARVGVRVHPVDHESFQAVDWAPISHAGQLHDRASYRFFWQLLQRAHDTGRPMPAEVRKYFVQD